MRLRLTVLRAVRGKDGERFVRPSRFLLRVSKCRDLVALLVCLSCFCVHLGELGYDSVSLRGLRSGTKLQQLHYILDRTVLRLAEAFAEVGLTTLLQPLSDCPRRGRFPHVGVIKNRA